MDSNPHTLSVSGEIVFGGDAQAFSGATAFVRVEDVSLMDAPSTVVAQQTIEGVAYTPGGAVGAIPFAVQGNPPADPRARLQLSVHISLTGADVIQSGDYLTIESYPVSTAESMTGVQVTVRQV
jgi:putative lipoprotein